MRNTVLALLLCIAGVASTGVVAAAEGDPDRGKEIFKAQCTACHNFIKGAKVDFYGVILPLYGIVGQKAAKVKGFMYSKAMRQSDVVWTEEMLEAYLADPKGTLPEIRMEFLGIPEAQDRADIIAYFKKEMAEKGE